MTIDYWLLLQAGIVTFFYVFLRAFQQLNVVHKHYWRIPFTSMGMGIGDVLLVLFIVKTETLWMGVTNGIGGTMGCYLAMYVNERMPKKKGRCL